MDFAATDQAENVPAVSQSSVLEDPLYAAAITQPIEDPAGQDFLHDNFDNLFAIVTGVESSLNDDNQGNQVIVDDTVADEDEACSIGKYSADDISDDDWEAAAAFCSLVDNIESLSSGDETREALAQQTERETANSPSEVSDENTIYQDGFEAAVKVTGSNTSHYISLPFQLAPPQTIELLSKWLSHGVSLPQTRHRIAGSIFAHTSQQITHRNLQAHPGPAFNSVHRIQTPFHQPAFPVYQDNSDRPRHPSSYKKIAPVPPHVLQAQSTNDSLNSQLFDRPSPAQMAKMKSAAIPPPADGRVSQQAWTDNEKDLLQQTAHQWWYWRDNGLLPREALSGAALIRLFEHEFAARGFARSFHQLKNQWNRQGRAEFGRSEQRAGAGGNPKNLITSARPNAKREIEILGGMRKRNRFESEENDNDENEGFRAHKIVRQ